MSPDQPVIGEQPPKPGGAPPQPAPPQPAPVVARLPRRRRRVLPPLLIALAEANATNALAQLKRSETLVAKLAASQQAFDDATAAARRTAAALVAAQRGLEAAEAQFAVTRSQIETAQAGLRSAAAQTEQARLDLSYTEVVASEAGTIAHKNVSPG